VGGGSASSKRAFGAVFPSEKERNPDPVKGSVNLLKLEGVSKGMKSTPRKGLGVGRQAIRDGNKSKCELKLFGRGKTKLFSNLRSEGGGGLTS